MPLPPLFGAPTSDPSGAFQANMRAHSDAAAMEVQAYAQAAQNVLGSLQAAAELRNRRDMQLRDIEAARKLEDSRQASASKLQGDYLDFQSTEAAKARANSQYNADREYALGLKKYGLQEKLTAAELESRAQDLAKSYRLDKEMADIQRHGDMASAAFRQLASRNPDGTYDISRLTELPEILKSFQVQQETPYSPEVLGMSDAAKAPGAESDVQRQLLELVKKLNDQPNATRELDIRQMGANADMMRAAGAGGSQGDVLEGLFRASKDWLTPFAKESGGNAAVQALLSTDPMFQVVDGRIEFENVSPEAKKALDRRLSEPEAEVEFLRQSKYRDVRPESKGAEMARNALATSYMRGRSAAGQGARAPQPEPEVAPQAQPQAQAAPAQPQAPPAQGGATGGATAWLNKRGVGEVTDPGTPSASAAKALPSRGEGLVRIPRGQREPTPADVKRVERVAQKSRDAAAASIKRELSVLAPKQRLSWVSREKDVLERSGETDSPYYQELVRVERGLIP